MIIDKKDNQQYNKITKRVVLVQKRYYYDIY